MGSPKKSSLEYTNGGHYNITFDPGDEKTEDLYKNEEEEEDLWALPDLKDTGKPWSELSAAEKTLKIILVIVKVVLLIGCLYMFICSIDFLGSAFRLLAGQTAGRVFQDNILLRNPVTAVMIGILATVLVQSSSTTTSIVVSMVAADELIDVKTAIPIVMGANIGTSVTNTIVAMGQITNKADFRRAFAGATVHDMFNWMTVLVLLPVEVISGYLYHLSKLCVDSLATDAFTSYEDGKRLLLKAITKPFSKLIVQGHWKLHHTKPYEELSAALADVTMLSSTPEEVDTKRLQKIAHSQEVDSLLKICCKTETTAARNETINGSWVVTNATSRCVEQCEYLFKDTGMSDTSIGAILFVVSLIILCLCLFAIVRIVNNLLRGNIRRLLKKFINYEFPGKCSYFTGYLAILFGFGMTILLQSSSVFTSTLTPLVGVGVISIERMYPLSLGSNIGTTATGILAALASDIDSIRPPLQVAFCHLFFNLTGIILFYPLPFMRLPIPLAKFLGCETSKYRWYAMVYIVVMFFLLPAAVFGLSLAGWEVLVGVCCPIVAIFLIILLVKLMQNKCPRLLPSKLKNWKFLPEPLRSLAPLDRVIQRLCFCNKLKCCQDDVEQHDDAKTVQNSVTRL